ncbi:MAG: hypothetical protein VW035_04535 [Luminiphilus sp.]|jgi:hypothetical protein
MTRIKPWVSEVWRMMLFVEELILSAFAINRPWGIEPVESFP